MKRKAICYTDILDVQYDPSTEDNYEHRSYFYNQFPFQGESNEEGKIGYLVLWFFGAPVGLLILLWLVLGDNIFGAG